jgi:hypothetical protein
MSIKAMMTERREPEDGEWWTSAMQAAAAEYARSVYRSDGYGYRVRDIIAAYEAARGEEGTLPLRRYVTTRSWKPELGPDPGGSLGEAIVRAVADGTLVLEEKRAHDPYIAEAIENLERSVPERARKAVERLNEKREHPIQSEEA